MAYKVITKDIKQKKLFILQQTHKFDILFIQETHFDNIQYAQYITRNWKGKWFWSFGNNLSKGVGTFISNKLECHLDNYTFDSEGRILCIDITLQKHKYRILNIYAPTLASERKDFITNLDNYLLVNRTFIIGGNWNFVENPSLDRSDSSISEISENKEIKKIKSDYELFETFRYQYPESKQYTWSARGAASRLDRFYISKKLKENLIKTEITSCTISDHDFCILYLDLNKVQDTNGPGYWKCNNSILDEKEFLQDFNLLIYQ